MKQLYYDRDSSCDFSIVILKLLEEIGEFSDAIVRGDIAKQSEELADVLAWLLSIANLLGIDAEAAFASKYPDYCIKCGSSPCSCDSVENKKKM